MEILSQHKSFRRQDYWKYFFEFLRGKRNRSLPAIWKSILNKTNSSPNATRTESLDSIGRSWNRINYVIWCHIEAIPSRGPFRRDSPGFDFTSHNPQPCTNLLSTQHRQPRVERRKMWTASRSRANGRWNLITIKKHLAGNFVFDVISVLPRRWFNKKQTMKPEIKANWYRSLR